MIANCTASSDDGSSVKKSSIQLTPVQRRWPHRGFSILDDVLGPDGHGPSSSHTIAPQRIAFEAFMLLGGVPETAAVYLFNSFATTGHGHRTDVAVTAGLLGFKPTDPRTRTATQYALQAGLRVDWLPTQDPTEHPNTLLFRLGRGSVSVDLKAISIGGGNYDVVQRKRLVRAA
jgi:L-serine dehydratase